ncbi:MAG: DUF3137 domain-containing protein [Aquificaceae bacterium]
MKSFEDLYREELKPLADVFEEKRRNLFFGFFVFLLLLPLVYFVALRYIPEYALLVPPLGLLFSFSFISFAFDRLRRGFKNQVMEKLVKFIDPSLEYYPEKFLPYSLYEKSLLFPENIHKYKGSDLVEGKVGLTSMAFSYVHSQRKERHTYIDMQGRLKTETRWVTVFQGILFMADFNKSFKSKVLVMPNSARIGSKLKHMKMDFPEFEKLFDVYGEDQIETRYILSTSLMERITRMWQKLKEEGASSMSLSFVDSHLFIAISLGSSFLKIPILRKVSYEHLLDYYEDIKLIYDIVEELNLNTRIWSKP